MRAYVLHGIKDLRFETVPTPLPKEGEVLVRMRASGICGSDIPRIYQTGAHTHPLIPGHEFAGDVVDIGKNVSAKWQNKEVGVYPLVPCRKCAPCKSKMYMLCRNYDYLGSRRDGGFAEFVTVPEWNLVDLQQMLSFEMAALLEPMSVAVHASRRVAMKNNDTAVVIGLGTIGLLLINYLKETGIERVLAIGNKEFQRQRALQLGVASIDYCDSRTTDARAWVQDRTEGHGGDAIFECVGKNDTYSLALDIAACPATIILVGNPSSDMKMTRNSYWKILRNQLDITGSWNSSFSHDKDDDWCRALKCLHKHHRTLSDIISHRVPFDHLMSGLAIMHSKKEVHGKIMLLSSF